MTVVIACSLNRDFYWEKYVLPLYYQILPLAHNHDRKEKSDT